MKVNLSCQTFSSSNLAVDPVQVVFISTDYVKSDYFRDFIALDQPREKISRALVAERHHPLHKTMICLLFLAYI